MAMFLFCFVLHLDRNSVSYGKYIDSGLYYA